MNTKKPSTDKIIVEYEVRIEKMMLKLDDVIKKLKEIEKLANELRRKYGIDFTIKSK